MRLLSRFVVAVLLAGIGVAAGTVLLARQAARVWHAGVAGSDAETLSLDPLASRSVVLARDGSVLATLHEEENRVPVPLSRVPPHVIRAVLDAEDDRFFEHGALDLRALTRALVVNVQAGGVFEGGSTITQQLVKISLLNPRQEASRKIKEAALAIRLEDDMSKEQILERYLNAVYLGNHAYGFQAGAETYFQTDIDKVTLGQGILLASLIRDPVGADPWTNPDEARARRDAVIDRMNELGHLQPGEAESLKAEALPTPPPQVPPKGSDYFTERVKQQLLADTRLGDTASERYAAVFKGGLTIRTTLDPGMQRMAEKAVADIVPDTGGRFRAAMVSVEPTTGAVRALVGGSDFANAKFDLAVQGAKQTGSSFKPFTLVAALENGFSINDSILGTAPCRIPNPGSEDWEPDNVEGSAGGVLTLTDATVQSVNCAYARLVKLVGPEKVVETAKRMGITAELQPFLSLTLGAQPVSPLDMASAYATLAADGQRHAPQFVDEVVGRDGRVLFKNESKGEQVVAPQVARTVNRTLTQVVQRGTGRAAAIPRWAPAGKTGSTDENTNAWFVGYTPTLATSVWMGNPVEDEPMRNVGGITVFGGTYPARIWRAFMSGALGDTPPVGFPEPEPSPPGQFRALPGERVQVYRGPDDLEVPRYRREPVPVPRQSPRVVPVRPEVVVPQPPPVAPPRPRARDRITIPPIPSLPR
ncbi:MAG TPA: transglycosylase domain-containing protein [Acidimicrobiales bacterium]|nr:transglycosylase domain-containing protein [Acidimicrobiales bacterium]